MPSMRWKPRSRGSIWNEPRFSSTDSLVMRGIWKSSTWRVLVLRGGPGRRGGVAREVSRRSARLLGVQLDDELLLDRRGDLAPVRLAEHLGGQPIEVRLEPRGHLGGELGRVADDRLRSRGGGLDGDDVALTNLVARDVDAAAVDRPMAVADHLARLAARRREAEPDDDVVEAGLEQGQQVLAGDARLPRRLVVVPTELALEHAVVATGLLLLAQLDPVLGLLRATTAVVAGRVGAALDAALVGQAALTLEEELLAFTTALLALGAGISSHSDAS